MRKVTSLVSSGIESVRDGYTKLKTAWRESPKSESDLQMISRLQYLKQILLDFRLRVDSFVRPWLIKARIASQEFIYTYRYSLTFGIFVALLIHNLTIASLFLNLVLGLRLALRTKQRKRVAEFKDELLKRRYDKEGV